MTTFDSTLPASATTATTVPSPARSPLGALLAGSTAMAFVGGSVAVSGLLRDAPMHTAQALRYAVACGLLVCWARWRRIALHRPTTTELAWLTGVVVTGLVLFNIGLVEGSAHAEPAVLAAAVASVPIVLALLGPVLERARPTTRVLCAAVVVTAGAALVQGFGRSDVVGLLWALLVLACEAAFTLLAVPVLRRHGPMGVSVWTTGLAAVVFAGLGLGLEGPLAIMRLTTTHLLASGYLAVAVTAVAFVLWYRCVQSLGAARAGLLTGVAPVSAAGVGAVLVGAVPAPAVWVGIALVGVGLAIGLSGRAPTPTDR